MSRIKSIGCITLVSMLAVCANAVQQSTEVAGTKTWTGTLTAVMPDGQAVVGYGFFSNKRFNLADHCTISTLDKKEAALADLRTGDRVEIKYSNQQGVLVATSIFPKALKYDGTIRSLDPNSRMLTMQKGMNQRKFRVPEDCKITLWNGNSGTLEDLKSGDALTLTYAKPGGLPVVRQAAGHSLSYEGTVEAVDLSARTVRANTMFGEKNFHMASGARISNGKQEDLGLKDLALGGKYKFTYVDVDGVNVVNYIAPVVHPTTPTTASTR